MILIIKKYWREILILLLFSICIIAMRSCGNRQSLVELERHGKDSAYHYATKIVQKNGEQLFRIRTLEATNHELKGTDILSTLEINKLKKQNVKLGDLVTYYQGRVIVSRQSASKAIDSLAFVVDSIQYAKNNLDSTVKIENEIIFKTFDWSNEYLRLHEIYNPVTDSLTRKYLYRVKFTLATYRQRQGLFKKSILLSDLSFDDPAVQVGEFKAIQVKEPKKRFYETRIFAFAVGMGLATYAAIKLH